MPPAHGGARRQERRHRRLKEQPDLQLFRHFRLVRTLGRGNFAAVYQVRRLADGEDYALKHIDLQAMDPAEHADLVNEIRLMAAADHPNLLTFHEAFVERAQLFVVTELAPGGDLGALLGKLDRRREGLPETEVWRYFLQLAAGLQYLHHNRVLHRDMKPENVLIGEHGLLKIADLGISQVLDHVFTRVLMGTPQYVAPEAWRGQPYSYSADVWALGCILHELCTRRPLFLPRGRPGDAEIRARVLEGKVTPISRKYSPDVWKLIRWLLVQNPAARPTADEIMELEMVQARMHLLPREVRAAVDGRRTRAILPNLFKISANPESWPQLNAVLPPARYADGDGQGVAAALCQQGAAASSAAAGADRQPQPQQQQQQQGGAANGHGGSNGSNGAAAPKGGRASPLFDFWAAYPGEAAKERLRRASTSAAVWEQAQLEKQQQQQQQQADVQRPQGPGQPPAGQEQQAQQGTAQQAQQGTAQQPPVRRRSMSDALRSRPRPPQPSPRLASSGGRGKFDASLPIEFGTYKGGGAGGTAKLAPAVARGSDLEDASYYGGDGTSTYGGSYHGGSYYEASYHGSYYGGSRAGGSYAGSHGGSYHGGTGAFYGDSSSYHGSSYHGGSYYERSGRGGFGSARAAEREREAKPKQPARTAAGGGLGAALRKLFCFG
ncbi:hypothetical protein COHA_006577 [Chlorella ohadii]|uniref:non-specific serine/threonine protein kinase n=1 Tax=Chlorella ohadii TaxID=2649997 RepID=A0AAD5DKP5_9CHLO|nr:hypothetical protein COHA_006577 [Chlorella ohadii]